MQSNGFSESRAASASSDEPTATISTSPPPPTSSMIDCRWASSSSTTSKRRTSRLMNDSIWPKTSARASADAGFWRNAAAPASNAGWTSSMLETMCTGMCRVPGCRLSRSSTVQPSSTGRVMSSTIASGRNSRASARPVSPRSATSPLKPRSRAISSSVRAKPASSSMISTTRSPSSIESRSSLTSLGKRRDGSRASRTDSSPLSDCWIAAVAGVSPAVTSRRSSAPVSAGGCST